MNDVDKLTLLAKFEARARTWGKWHMCGFGDELPEFYAAEAALGRVRRKLQGILDAATLDRYEARLQAYWTFGWVEIQEHLPQVQKLKARLIRERKRVLSALGLTAAIAPAPETPALPPNAVRREAIICHGRSLRRGS